MNIPDLGLVFPCGIYPFRLNSSACFARPDNPLFGLVSYEIDAPDEKTADATCASLYAYMGRVVNFDMRASLNGEVESRTSAGYIVEMVKDPGAIRVQMQLVR